MARDRSLIRLRPRAGTTYVSSDRTVLATRDDGVLEPGLNQGLFVDETRLLSLWRWRIEGAAPQPVSSSNVALRSWLGYYIAPAPGGRAERERDPISGAAQEAVELRLSRYVGGGMHEDVDLANFARWPVRLSLELEIGSDFADPSETGGERRQKGRKRSVWSEGDGTWDLATTYEATHRYAHQGETGTARLRRGLTVRFSHAATPPRRRG